MMLRPCLVFALIALFGCTAGPATSAPATTPVDATAPVDAASDTGARATPDGAQAADTGDGAAADTADVPKPALHAVGVIEIETAGAFGRKLPTMVWYPAVAGPSEGADAVSYLGGLAKSPGGARLGSLPAKGPFPLVAFSHGNQGSRDQSYFLAEALARHGYVVVAPDHVGNTFFDYDAKLFGVMAIWRPQDLTAAISRVLQPQAKDPKWLQGLVDPAHIAAAGHSFGGYTALAVAGAAIQPPGAYLPNCKTAPEGDVTCKTLATLGAPPWDFRDARVKLAIPLAHGLTAGFAKASLAALPVPVIMQAAVGDTTTPMSAEALPTYKAVVGPRALVVLQGGTHFSYANVCELVPLLPAARKRAFAPLCADDAVPTIAVSHAAIVHYTLAACDVYLRGKNERRAAFAPGKSSKFPVEIQASGIDL